MISIDQQIIIDLFIKAALLGLFNELTLNKKIFLKKKLKATGCIFA